MSRSWYYKHKAGRLTPREARRQVLTAEIRRLFTAHRATYGSPRITADLREAGCVRGHEKVPVCGQVEVLAGGQLKVPIPRSPCLPGVCRPGRRRWRYQPVTVTAQGASIEVCEGTDGHHFRLP